MFFATHRVVMCAGRRIVCRPATCETVFRALATYRDEFCRIAKKQNDKALSADVVEVVLMEACADERLPFVLDPSIELWGGAPGEVMELLALQPQIARECLAAVLSLTDVRTIAREFRYEPPEPMEPDDEEKPRDQVAIAIVKVAMAFGCSPSSVMVWPYAAFMAARDHLIELSEQEPQPIDAPDTEHSRGVRRKTTRLSLDSPVEELIAAGLPYARGGAKA